MPYFEVSYYIKAIYSTGIVKGEIINSIAMSSSKGMNMIINEPNYKEKQELSCDLPVKQDIRYIKVMAKLNRFEQKLFYLYNPIELKNDEKLEPIKLNKTTSVQKIKYEANKNSITAIAKEALKKQHYQLNFENKDKLPNYIKVEAVHKEGKNNSPLLYFSSTDSKGIKNRTQLSYGGSNKTEMWIKKDQLESNKFYLAVECYEEKNCGYQLNFTGDNEVVFEEMRVFNYYVSEQNKKMIFKFRSKNPQDGNILTLYTVGGKNILLNLDDCFDETCEQYNFTDGAAITITTRDVDYYVLELTADAGDYISVGAKIIFDDGISDENNLEPGLGQVTGFLRRELIEKGCYKLPTIKDNIYYLTVNFYNSMAFISFTDDNLNQIEGDIDWVKNGFYSSVYSYKEKKRDYLCISFYDLDEVQETISYSLQIQSNKEFKNNNYLPQYTGFI